MSFWLFNEYMDAMMKEVKVVMGRTGESIDCLASCMQMTWFCGASRRKTRGHWWDVLLRCVGEEVSKSMKVRAR